MTSLVGGVPSLYVQTWDRPQPRLPSCAWRKAPEYACPCAIAARIELLVELKMPRTDRMSHAARSRRPILTTTLLSSVVFSYLFFNVVSPKVLMPMVVSGVWVSAYVYRICFVQVKKLPYYQKWPLFLIGITLLTISGALSLDNSIRPKYSVRPLFNQIYNETKTAQCSYIVVSHEIGVAVLKYYEVLLGKHFPLSARVIPINFKSDSALEKIRPAIAAISDPASARCEKLIYFQYYDFWVPQEPLYAEFHSLLTRYYTESSTAIVDPLNLSLSIYTKKPGR